MQGNGRIRGNDERAAWSHEHLAGGRIPLVRAVHADVGSVVLRHAALRIRGAGVDGRPTHQHVAVTRHNSIGRGKRDAKTSSYRIKSHGTASQGTDERRNGAIPLCVVVRADIEGNRMRNRLVEQAQNFRVGRDLANGLGLHRGAVVRYRRAVCQVFVASGHEQVLLRIPAASRGHQLGGCVRVGSLARHTLVHNTVQIRLRAVRILGIASRFGLRGFEVRVGLDGVVLVYNVAVLVERYNHAVARNNPALDEVGRIIVCTPYRMQCNRARRRHGVGAARCREHGAARRCATGGVISLASRNLRFEAVRAAHGILDVVNRHLFDRRPADERVTRTSDIVVAGQVERGIGVARRRTRLPFGRSIPAHHVVGADGELQVARNRVVVQLDDHMTVTIDALGGRRVRSAVGIAAVLERNRSTLGITGVTVMRIVVDVRLGAREVGARVFIGDAPVHCMLRGGIRFGSRSARMLRQCAVSVTQHGAIGIERQHRAIASDDPTLDVVDGVNVGSPHGVQRLDGVGHPVIVAIGDPPHAALVNTSRSGVHRVQRGNVVGLIPRRNTRKRLAIGAARPAYQRVSGAGDIARRRVVVTRERAAGLQREHGLGCMLERAGSRRIGARGPGTGARIERQTKAQRLVVQIQHQVAAGIAGNVALRFRLVATLKASGRKLRVQNRIHGVVAMRHILVTSHERSHDRAVVVRVDKRIFTGEVGDGRFISRTHMRGNTADLGPLAVALHAVDHDRVRRVVARLPHGVQRRGGRRHNILRVLGNPHGTAFGGCPRGRKTADGGVGGLRRLARGSRATRTAIVRRPAHEIVARTLEGGRQVELRLGQMVEHVTIDGILRVFRPRTNTRIKRQLDG